jgi:propanol-preferring alcohol dehydrogenase
VLPSDSSAVGAIRSLTGGVGAQAVFDFVGAPPTVEIARKTVALDGVVQIVGIGGAVLPTGFFSTPMGASVRAPYWGTRTELMEVLDLARAGALHVEVERYPLGEAPAAYRRLHEGSIRGRAVVVPGD